VRDFVKQVRDMAAVIRMGRRASRDLTQKVPRRYSIDVGAAYASGGFGVYPAGTHVAYFATRAVESELAVILLSIVTVETGFNTILLRFLKHFDRSGVVRSVLECLLNRIAHFFSLFLPVNFLSRVTAPVSPLTGFIVCQ
jgi:hypothetical protein